MTIIMRIMVMMASSTEAVSNAEAAGLSSPGSAECTI